MHRRELFRLLGAGAVFARDTAGFVCHAAKRSAWRRVCAAVVGCASERDDSRDD